MLQIGKYLVNNGKEVRIIKLGEKSIGEITGLGFITYTRDGKIFDQSDRIDYYVGDTLDIKLETYKK